MIFFLKSIFNIVTMKARKKTWRASMVEEEAQAGTYSLFTTELAKTTMLRSQQSGRKL